MKTFLWTMILLIGITCIGKLILLAKGEFPRRDPRTEALDVVINGAIIVWAALLLVQS
jgi:hypothetical protein